MTLINSMPENIDILMVLAGEDAQTRPRTNKAIQVYNEYGSIPVLLTGSHAGAHSLYLPKGMQPLSHQMREYMLEKGVKDSDIIIEDKSLDTIANFYFPYTEEILSYGDKIGLVTDEKHMPRSKWLSKKICGFGLHFTQIPSPTEYGICFSIQEKIITACLKWDLIDIQNGNILDLHYYMKKVHPFHARLKRNNPKFSFYGLLASASMKGKDLGINIREKEIQKN